MLEIPKRADIELMFEISKNLQALFVCFVFLVLTSTLLRNQKAIYFTSLSHHIWIEVKRKNDIARYFLNSQINVSMTANRQQVASIINNCM